MTSRLHFSAKLSLVFLWVFTGITSAFFGKDIGYEVLAGAGITGTLATFSILSGSILDVAIGVWLLLGKRMQFCYLVQGVVIITYTLLLTIIAPTFWIHPFGPLSKNIPLLVMIYYLYSLEFAKCHPADSDVVVYYNPNNPADSVLIPGRRKDKPFSCLILGAFGIVFGVVIAALAWMGVIG